MYSQEKDKVMRTKDIYLTVGKDMDKNELHQPMNQYRHKTSPGTDTKKKKIHYLKIYPPTVRLIRHEKELAEKLKVLVFQSML